MLHLQRKTNANVNYLRSWNKTAKSGPRIPQGNVCVGPQTGDPCNDCLSKTFALVSCDIGFLGFFYHRKISGQLLDIYWPDTESEAFFHCVTAPLVSGPGTFRHGADRRFLAWSWASLVLGIICEEMWLRVSEECFCRSKRNDLTTPDSENSRLRCTWQTRFNATGNFFFFCNTLLILQFRYKTLQFNIFMGKPWFLTGFWYWNLQHNKFVENLDSWSSSSVLNKNNWTNCAKKTCTTEYNTFDSFNK